MTAGVIISNRLIIDVKVVCFRVMLVFQWFSLAQVLQHLALRTYFKSPDILNVTYNLE